MARLTRRVRGGEDASDATIEVAERIRARFDPWPTAHVVDTAEQPKTSMRAALRWLAAAERVSDADHGAPSEKPSKR
jgi:predicted kinase